MVPASIPAWPGQCLACTASGSKDGGIEARRMGAGGKAKPSAPDTEGGGQEERRGSCEGGGGVSIKSRPPVRAQGKWGQQLWHKRGSGLFYCHLKTTFKMRLSLPKKRKKTKTEPRKCDHLTVLWNMSLGLPGLWPDLRCQLQASTSLQVGLWPPSQVPSQTLVASGPWRGKGDLTMSQIKCPLHTGVWRATI